MNKRDIYDAMVGGIAPYTGIIYLVCCVGVEYDYDILPHFIKYYKDLGVDEFLIILNTIKKKSEKLKLVQNILRKYDIEEKLIWSGYFNEETKINHMRNLVGNRTFHDDWIIYADVDEFSDFVVDLRKLITYCEKKEYNCVQGKLIQHLAKDGKLPDIDDDTNLEEMFPVVSDITKTVYILFHMGKIPLCKSYIKLSGGHHQVMSKVYNLFPSAIDVHHFKWRKNAIESFKDRIVAYKLVDDPCHIFLKKLVDYYEEYKSFLDLK